MAHDEAALAELQRQFWAAANAGDEARLRELLDDDFVYIQCDSLERKDKEGFIADLADRPELDVVSFELASVVVQQQGDMAACYAHYHIEQDDDGERFRTSGNAIEMLVKRASGWKVVGSVFGEVPPFVE